MNWLQLPTGTTEHPVNRYSDRKILVSVWDFGPLDKNERSYYLHHDHPCKMRPRLARAVLQLYGESPVLDPMAGIGTTLVEAALLGLDAFGVEYEKKFVDKANENVRHARTASCGKAVCYKGDARNLSLFSAEKFGSVFFSPPYFQESIVAGLKKPRIRAKVGYSLYGYSTDPRNISTIQTYRQYLNEMLKVYIECFRVLKSGKFMVIVVKDLRRGGLTVPVAADAIKLCEFIGFQTYEVIVNKIYAASFWAINHAKKWMEKREPKAMKIHEYVLVFRKPKERAMYA